MSIHRNTSQNRWRAYAVEQTQQSPDLFTIDSVSDKTHHSDTLTECENHIYQMSIVLPTTHHCFCQKPAHRMYTHEYGPILECNSFGKDASEAKFICGFHVHELSWSPFCDRVRRGHLVPDRLAALRTCCLYNFTFCALFNTTNDYVLHPPLALPECFCRRSVVMRRHPQEGLQFTCANMTIDGAQKCSWLLNGRRVAFSRPSFTLHTYVSHDEYVQRYQTVLQEIHEEIELYEREGG